MINRAYGCLVGAAIGDAMGMPASFMSPEKIKWIYGRITGFLSPDKEQLAHGKLAAGEITDDTEENLIVASVLIEAGKFEPNLFIKKMREWAVNKRMLESTVIGPSTRRFLEAILNGKDITENGRLGDTNGGAMRVAPVGIYYHGDIHAAIQGSIASAMPSHGSKPGLASSAAVGAAIAAAVEGNCSPIEVMQAAIHGADAGEREGYDIPAPSVAARIRLAIELIDRNRDKSLEDASYVLYQYIGAGMKSYESIPLSLGIFYAAGGDYSTGLLAAVNTGDDADTNGAITGALCGAYSGADKINPDWITRLRETNSIDFLEIASHLLERKHE